jgi:hypothetical protein
VDVELGDNKVSSAVKGKGKAREDVKAKQDEEDEEGVKKNEWWETFLGNFTLYLDLRNARTDSDFEAVLHQLKMEWTFMGGFVSLFLSTLLAIPRPDYIDRTYH